MRKEKRLLQGLVTAVAVAIPTGTQAQQRPNIILFMVDDMGWQDTSVAFWNRRTPLNDTYETPNMERLAREGMLFSQAYAAPISSPSRCSLMTGCNAARHRVTNWTLRRDESTDIDDPVVRTPEWNYNGITQQPITTQQPSPTTQQQTITTQHPTPATHVFSARTFVDILRANGYRTIHVGKAHWGALDTPGERPEHFGFEVNIAGHAAGGPATYLSERNYGYDADGNATSPMATPGLQKYWQTGTFLTEALTKECLAALDTAKQTGKPFYLYMSHYAVHIPIDRDQRYYQKYRDKGLSEKEAAYAALIEGMDHSLGDILQWLDDNDMARNTVVIFMSDNGGYATGSYYRDEPLYTQNAPLRSGKGSLLEGGIREPMIVRWPGVVKEGSRCDSYVMIEDFYPTILEMAGIGSYRVPQTVDGRSFMPLLRQTGDPSRRRALVWNFPNVWGNTGPGISLNCAIRQDEWKLIYNYKTGEKELYNIDRDISETHNLASEYPDVVKRMSRRLGRQLRKMKAQRPFFKATGLPCPWPDEKR
ncbi:MAG: sulfatase [Prevotella sp.]|nr:sulfatase [Prevotella sp.]